MSAVSYAVLALTQLVGLLLIPFGLPGLWIQLAGLVGYAYLTGFTTVGLPPLLFALALATAAELLEFWLGGHYARRYGGGRRAGWGAILGGIVGAIAGLPVPVIGSILGAFVGSFAGAALLEATRRRGVSPTLRAGWGALLGRVAAAGLKAGIGVLIAGVALFAAVG
ncbi:hypothetical protein BH23GEM4_BH23GEM4_07060 [soil metagenome]